MMEVKRSKGVTILAIVFLFIGVFSVLSNTMSIVHFDTPPSLIAAMIIFTLYFLLLGIGLLLLKKWARILLFISSLMWIVLGLLGIILTITNRVSGVMAVPIFALFFLLCLIFITRPQVKQQFGLEEMVRTERPVWITIFGWVLLLWGIYLAFFIDTYFEKPFFRPIVYANLSGLFSKIIAIAYGWIHPIVSLVYIPLGISMAIGFILYKNWARLLLIGISIFQLAYSFFWVVFSAIYKIEWLRIIFSISNFTNILIGAIVPILCIYFFTRPKVKAQFK